MFSIFNKTLVFMICAFIANSAALAELVQLKDEDLSRVSGQLLIDPLGELSDEVFTQIENNSNTSEHSGQPKIFIPLSTLELSQQAGQGVRVVHTVFPTGARSPDAQVGVGGNLNFYGRDYRTGDNFDKTTECYNGTCGWFGNWDADGDGIPGNGGNNPDFIPAGDGTGWAAGADGRTDDYYYEHDYYAAFGANATVPDSAEDWHFYRIETEALIKIVATIDRLSQGGYTANYGGCGFAFEVATDNEVLSNNGNCGAGFSNYSTTVGGTEGSESKSSYQQNYSGVDDRMLATNDRDNYFSYDSEIRNIHVGSMSCEGIADSRATYLNGNGSYMGHCEADERNFDPFTIKNPYTEIALAPECELFADPACDSGGSTDLVFAGYRSGFESVSGSAQISQYTSSGSTNAVLPSSSDITCNPTGIGHGADLGSSQSVCNGYVKFLDTFATSGVLLFGHRARGMAALPSKLCVTGTFLLISSTTCSVTGTGPEGLQNNLAVQDAQGLWTSVVRNDFQWPGQGWAADDGNTTTPTSYRSTLADRDYAGFNTHIPAGGVGHGGTVINNYSPAVLLGLGAAYTRTEIGL